MSASHGHEVDPTDGDGRLANRATLLTLASLCSFLLAAMVMPLTFQSTDRVAPRIAASTPVALGVGVGLIARTTRARLRALREQEDGVSVAQPSETEPDSPGGASRASAASASPRASASAARYGRTTR